jgi:lipoyl-dependent peroxiredoxin
MDPRDVRHHPSFDRRPDAAEPLGQARAGTLDPLNAVADFVYGVTSITWNRKENHMKRTASAVWEGDLKQGHGAISTQSGTLKDTQYSFATRFENGVGTNPEELIAAAHAGCFTMALSAKLGAAGFTPEKLTTNATLALEQVDGNWTITTVHLALTAKVPNITAEKFDEIAADAKANCPVSRVLNATIDLESTLE